MATLVVLNCNVDGHVPGLGPYSYDKYKLVKLCSSGNRTTYCERISCFTGGPTGRLFRSFVTTTGRLQKPRNAKCRKRYRGFCVNVMIAMLVSVTRVFERMH